MKLIWEVSEQDVQKIHSFMELHKNDPMVKNRIERNADGVGIDLSKSTMWFSLVSCLMTTQQRSGPESNVVRFINTKPFPLNYELCVSKSDIGAYSIVSAGTIVGKKIPEKVIVSGNPARKIGEVKI